MRLALWRTGKSAEKPAIQRSAPAAATGVATRVNAGPGDLDLRALGDALARGWRWIIVPTLLAAILSAVSVNLITPRYKSEARILIDGRENVFLRPSAERSEERTALDAEAVTSQVQLLLSRDLAREIIRTNKLADRPEFDPILQGVSPLKSLLALIGIGRDPFSLTPEERVLDSYYDRFTAYAVDKSRVIVIEFQSRDPELASRVSNSIAEGYLVLQQNARQKQAKAASQWLSGEIEDLRKKVAEAESRVEEFRSKSSLFVGTNNTTLSNQQMGELNTQLNNARALKSDAESKARLIREMLQGGKPIESSEVLNSELIRRLSEQRVALRGQLAEQSSTLLDNHPRIKELKAQLADLDRQLREEASKISRSLDSDARIADGRVEGLSASLEQLKKQASSTNGQDVQLRALEREAKAQRDLLEAYLARYREANTRENIESTPADGRIISKATPSNVPAYPKKLPIVLIATLATLMLSAGAIATGELLRITAPRAVTASVSSPAQLREPIPPTEPMFTASALEGANGPSFEIKDAVNEIEKLAADLTRETGSARKITVLGTTSDESIALTMLTLARLLARGAKVVAVDLSACSAIPAASIDQAAPGLAELIAGEASLSQVITKDRWSRAQLVSTGRAAFDRALLRSPRLALVIEALLQVYDHVLLDGGSAPDLVSQLLTVQARAILVPDAAMTEDARLQMCDQLKVIGFSDVRMVSPPPPSPDVVEAGPRVAA
ncbi:MAG TPA: exopolysaccharide transport family protein [Bradyrhizobium sp.]|uniref:GumC family protein n=1 Tax=Bradyrhizobium sp. TaxID=376 RepID=UPI002B4698F6|nr:exopolysaccharide transport family protein [Bradyrhizobium sp.]HKO71715.1 exopolysaccharide transport family protein [Bradyrhizobium sp.]